MSESLFSWFFVMNSKKLICLAALLLICGCGWIWYSVISPQNLLDQANELAQNHPRQALELVQEAMFRSVSDYPEAELLRVKILILSGRREESLGAFSLIEHPERLPAEKLLEIGKLAQESRNYFLSELAYQAAAKNPSHQVVALRALIQVLLFTRQEFKALTFVDQLIEVNSQDPLAWQIRGNIELNQRHLAEAERAFRECLKLTQNQDQEQSVRENLIQILIDRGNVREARKELDTYLEKFLRTAQVRLEEAYLLRLEGHPEQGLERIEQLCETDHPQRIKAVYLRGLLRLDLKNLEIAIGDFKTVIKQQPWHKSTFQTCDGLSLSRSD